MTLLAKTLIANNLYMTVASANSDGKPWASPVFFANDDQYNLYWVSYKGCTHSKNIRQRKEVGIVIYDSTAPEGQGMGVYFDAEAYELSEPEAITLAIATLSQKVTVDEYKVKDINEVSGEGLWRIYLAKPKTISMLSGETVDGQWIDKRIEVSL